MKEIDFINAWNAMLLEIPSVRLEFIQKPKKNFKTYLLSNTNEIHIKKFEEDLSNTNELKDFQDFLTKYIILRKLG